MGAKIFLGLTGVAIGFMLYVLFHFAEEGNRRPGIPPVAKFPMNDRSRKARQTNSKAA